MTNINNEKQIISGIKKPNTIAKILVIVAFLMIPIMLFVYLTDYIEECSLNLIRSNIYGYIIDRYGFFNGISKIFGMLFELFTIPRYLIKIVITVFICFGLMTVGVLWYSKSLKVQLSITDKTLYGTQSDGRKCMIPLNCIKSFNKTGDNGILIRDINNQVFNFSSFTNIDQIVSVLSKINDTPKENNDIVENVTQNTQSKKDTISEDNKIEMIKQYKELFDAGAITKDEFDELKRKVL